MFLIPPMHFDVLTLDVLDKPVTEYLRVLRYEVVTNEQTFLKFSQEELITILSNFLILHGKEEFIEEDFVFIGSILEHVYCVLKLQDEDDMDEDIDLNITSPVVNITEKISDSLISYTHKDLFKVRWIC